MNITKVHTLDDLKNLSPGTVVELASDEKVMPAVFAGRWCEWQDTATMQFIALERDGNLFRGYCVVEDERKVNGNGRVNTHPWSDMCCLYNQDHPYYSRVIAALEAAKKI